MTLKTLISSEESGTIDLTKYEWPGGVGTPRTVATHRERMSGMGTIRIPLHSRKYPNLHTLIDEEDYEMVSQYRWHPCRCPSGKFYAASGKSSQKLHRLILNAGEEQYVDHRNLDTLDNRRSNLRISTHAQNCANSGKRSHSKSPFKGVTKTPDNTWDCSIQSNGNRVYVGKYATAKDAAYAYDQEARLLHGNFAKTNVDIGLLDAGFKGSPPISSRYTSAYRGVTRKTKDRNWTARLSVNGREFYLGMFVEEEDAAKAYDEASTRLLGSKAKLNFDAVLGETK